MRISEARQCLQENLVLRETIGDPEAKTTRKLLNTLA
jgi:hypothetical protein